MFLLSQSQIRNLIRRHGAKMSKRLIEIELDEVVEDEIIVIVKKSGIIKSEIRVNEQGDLIRKDIEND